MKKTICMIGILVLFMASVVFATNNVTNAIGIEEAKKYSLFENVVDKIKYIFTIQIERRIELINKITEKRLAHYNFLMDSNKTEQAEKYLNKTVGLIRNFDEWKINKQNISLDNNRSTELIKKVIKTEIYQYNKDKSKFNREDKNE